MFLNHSAGFLVPILQGSVASVFAKVSWQLLRLPATCEVCKTELHRQAGKTNEELPQSVLYGFDAQLRTSA